MLLRVGVSSPRREDDSHRRLVRNTLLGIKLPMASNVGIFPVFWRSFLYACVISSTYLQPSFSDRCCCGGGRGGVPITEGVHQTLNIPSFTNTYPQVFKFVIGNFRMINIPRRNRYPIAYPDFQPIIKRKTGPGILFQSFDHQAIHHPSSLSIVELIFTTVGHIFNCVGTTSDNVARTPSPPTLLYSPSFTNCS